MGNLKHGRNDMGLQAAGASSCSDAYLRLQKHRHLDGCPLRSERGGMEDRGLQGHWAQQWVVVVTEPPCQNLGHSPRASMAYCLGTAACIPKGMS